jgi:hypothetical protein
MAQQALTADERRIKRRLSAIEARMSDLEDLWNYACDTDAHYRMVEAEREGLRKERTRLQELLGDL